MIHLVIPQNVPPKPASFRIELGHISELRKGAQLERPGSFKGSVTPKKNLVGNISHHILGDRWAFENHMRHEAIADKPKTFSAGLPLAVYGTEGRLFQKCHQSSM